MAWKLWKIRAVSPPRPLWHIRRYVAWTDTTLRMDGSSWYDVGFGKWGAMGSCSTIPIATMNFIGFCGHLTDFCVDVSLGIVYCTCHWSFFKWKLIPLVYWSIRLFWEIGCCTAFWCMRHSTVHSLTFVWGCAPWCTCTSCGGGNCVTIAEFGPWWSKLSFLDWLN